MTWQASLELARYALLVGRDAECALFEEALHSDAADVLLVTGGLGYGKTSLLRHFATEARTRGHVVHAFEITASENIDALHAQMQATAPEAADVFLVDVETAALAEEALHRLLPILPGAARLVVATPQAPEIQRIDAALRRLVRELPLRLLDEADSRALLAAHGAPESAHDALLCFAGGLPLALALGADACVRAGTDTFDPAADPDFVAALAIRYLNGAATREARTALYAAALVRTLDEPLLAAMLDVDDAFAPFEALRKRPFVCLRACGLTLETLARHALVADVRWRNPDLYATLHRRARAAYAHRLSRTSDTDHGAVLSDYLFLLRHNPIVQPFFRLLMHDDGRLVAGEGPKARWRTAPAEPEQYAAVTALVARHEGRESARWAAHWLRAQPGSAQVYLNPEGQVEGLLMALALDAEGPVSEGDPAVEAAQAYLAAHAPLRKGERATLFRFWMGAESYQGVSPILGLVFADTVRHYLTTPRLAFSFLPFADADAWGLVMAVAGLTRLPEASFDVDGHDYGVFAQDWRRIPPADWLDRIAQFGMASEPPAAPRAPRHLLDRDAYAQAVRAALRDFTRPEALLQSPLLDTRIGSERRGHEAPSETLRRVLREAAAPLAASPRTAKLHRALDATFFDPAPTQEQAAEHLDVPFSTYRRHLRAGIDAVTEALWARELGGHVSKR